MASTYITKTDLANNNKIILGLLGERDTKITQNELDIAELQDALDSLDTGLHYVGVALVVPTNPDDGALYYFNVPASGTDPAIVGYKFWVSKENNWRSLGGGTDENAVHYKGETTTEPTSPENGDLYYFNIPAAGTSAAIVGLRLYDGTKTEWIDMGGIGSGDMATTAINFTTEITQL